MGITGPACFGFERQWLSKSTRNIPQRPDLFSPDSLEDAQYLLGLGNRQVLAIEYWLKCAGLTQKSAQGTVLTPLGELIREFDPLFEERETWFALHHSLCAKRSGASTYWFAFRRMPRQFTRGLLLDELAKEFPGKSRRTYEDAVTVFFSILAKTELTSLCGVARIEGNTVFVGSDPEGLQPAVFAYMLCDWAKEKNLSSAHISELSQTDGPARPLSLSLDTVNRFLDAIQDRYSKRLLWVSRTAGLNSITFAEGVAPLTILRAYYLEHLQGQSPLESLRNAIEGK